MKGKSLEDFEIIELDERLDMSMDLLSTSGPLFCDNCRCPSNDLNCCCLA